MHSYQQNNNVQRNVYMNSSSHVWSGIELNRAQTQSGIRGGSRNLGRGGGGGGHRKGVGAGGGCAPSRAKRGSFEQYSNTDTHS